MAFTSFCCLEHFTRDVLFLAYLEYLTLDYIYVTNLFFSSCCVSVLCTVTLRFEASAKNVVVVAVAFFFCIYLTVVAGGRSLWLA